MDQLLIDSPLPALLGLMSVLVIGIIILVAYIFIAFKKRSKKSNMAYDAQPQTTPAEESAAFELPETSINTPAGNALSSGPPDRRLPPASEDSLNLGLLSKAINTEDAMPDTQKTSDQESVDVGARLNPQTFDPPQPSPFSEPVELLRLLRDPQSGRLIVEIAGQRYAKLADVTDKKIGQCILQLTAHLLAFTNGMIVTNAGMKSIYNPKVGQTPEPIVSPQKTQSGTAEPPPVPKAPPEVEVTFLASLQAAPPQPELKPQKPGLFGRTQPDPPPVPSLNLAEEINDIVQTRLRYSPMAETIRIEITSDPGGGIRIQVNDQFYSSPDDVLDQAARDLIKASIKEWERK